MKVMGSATLFFEAIVIGLTMPVAIAIYGVPKSQAIWTAVGLMTLCFAAIGAIRRERRVAVVTGTFVQAVVLISSIWVRPMLFPGLIFTIVWLLAVKLSEKTPA